MSLCQADLNPPAPPDILGKTTQCSQLEGANSTFKSILITPVPLLKGATLDDDKRFSDMLLDTEEPGGGSHVSERDRYGHNIDPINVSKDDLISLSEDDKKRIYRSWVYSVIIKVLGKRINHQYLKKKLSSLWRAIEEIILIDLGHDYYIVKFMKEENLQSILQNGPWFINGYFLSVKRWHPNFVASEAKENFSVIWLRLPELPTEFYDHSILARVGRKVGKLVKTDVCTSATLRGRYARICVEVPLGTPVQKFIYIGHHKQNIVYEGSNIFCNNSGVLGHNTINCPTTEATKCNSTNMAIDKEAAQPHEEKHKVETQQNNTVEKWQTINYSRRSKQYKRPRTTNEPEKVRTISNP
ncbi:hypothetical protein KY285_013084 [Solanum tuberosum]|nr:hypothetical protein KY285_013084 [Solanum tuberosum]